MSNWQIPTDLPDLRRVGISRIDPETKDGGYAPTSAQPGRRVTAISAASASLTAPRGKSAHYFPIRHPDTENFDPSQVYQWLKDLIASDVRFVTQNGLYDWGWLRTEAGILMPPSDRLEEIGALATIVDENRFRYSLDALCTWRGLPGKDETLLREAVKAAGFRSPRTTRCNPTFGECQRGSSDHTRRPTPPTRSRCARASIPSSTRRARARPIGSKLICCHGPGDAPPRHPRRHRRRRACPR